METSVGNSCPDCFFTEWPDSDKYSVQVKNSYFMKGLSQAGFICAGVHFSVNMGAAIDTEEVRMISLTGMNTDYALRMAK